LGRKTLGSRPKPRFFLESLKERSKELLETARLRGFITRFYLERAFIWKGIII
jgi:hypothetical protein